MVTFAGPAGRRTASSGTSVAHHACGVVPGSVAATTCGSGVTRESHHAMVRDPRRGVILTLDAGGVRMPTHAEIAQLVERRTENPGVRGSIPRLGTFSLPL